MIDYDALCQAIADWKAGQRPVSGAYPVSESAPIDTTGGVEEVEEVSSGLVMLDGEGSDEYQTEAPVEGGGQEGQADPYYAEDGAVSDQAAYEGEAAYEGQAEGEQPQGVQDDDIPIETQ